MLSFLHTDVPVSKTCIFIVPRLQQDFDITFSFNKTMRPEWNAIHSFSSPVHLQGLKIVQRVITISNTPLFLPSLASTPSPTLHTSFIAIPPASPSVGYHVLQNRQGQASRLVREDMHHHLLSLFHYLIYQYAAITIIYRFITHIGQTFYCECCIKIAKSGCSHSVFKYHTLGKTGCRVFIAEARKRLYSIEIPVILFYQFFQGKIEPYRFSPDHYQEWLSKSFCIRFLASAILPSDLRAVSSNSDVSLESISMPKGPHPL